MQLLLIHSDFIEYEVKKSTPVAEKIGDDLKSGRMEDALTAFIAVEKPDETSPQYVIDKGVESILKMAGQVKATRDHALPLRPPQLSTFRRPKSAVEVLTGLEAALKAKGLRGQAGSLRMVQDFHDQV